jgi:hypothetical protein
MLVVAGVALTAAGSAKLAEHKEPLDKDKKIAEAGIAILAVAWGVLVGWTGFSFTAPKGRNFSLTRAGTVVRLPLPHLERVVDANVSSYSQPSASPSSSSASASSTVSLRWSRSGHHLTPSPGRWLSARC